MLYKVYNKQSLPYPNTKLDNLTLFCLVKLAEVSCRFGSSLVDWMQYVPDQHWPLPHLTPPPAPKPGGVPPLPHALIIYIIYICQVPPNYDYFVDSIYELVNESQYIPFLCNIQMICKIVQHCNIDELQLRRSITSLYCTHK